VAGAINRAGESFAIPQKPAREGPGRRAPRSKNASAAGWRRQPGRLPLPSSAGAVRALLGLGEELANRIVGLARRLDLRHVSAVELDMTSPRQRLGHMPREGDRDEPVASTPDEQRVGLPTAQSRPEAAPPVG